MVFLIHTATIYSLRACPHYHQLTIVLQQWLWLCVPGFLLVLTEERFANVAITKSRGTTLYSNTPLDYFSDTTL